MGLGGVVLVATVNAVFNLGSPWGYVIFVCFFLLAYAAFLWLLERVRTTFPSHRLKLGKLWYADVADKYHPGEEVRVLFLPLEYTNLEPAQRVSLHFELLWRREVQDQVLGPGTVSRWDRYDSILPDPLHVPPETTESGDLAFQPYETWVFEYGAHLEVWAKPNFRLSLRTTDHVSGRQMEQDVPERERGR